MQNAGDNTMISGEDVGVSAQVLGYQTASAACVVTTKGLCSFQLYPGDSKAYVENPTIGDSTLGSADGKAIFKTVRFFYKDVTADPTQCVIGAFKNNDPYFETGIAEGGTEFTDDILKPLENDRTYCMISGVVDNAGNIGYYTDATNFNSDRSQAAVLNRLNLVVPSEVVGFFTDQNNCFIATAAYGSSLDSHVDTFREFRDTYLAKSRIGRKFITFYYASAPYWAHKISKSEAAKALARFFLWPLFVFAWLLLHPIWMLTVVFAFSSLFVSRRKLYRLTAQLKTKYFLIFIFGFLAFSLKANAATSRQRLSATDAPPAEAPYPGANEEEEAASSAIPLTSPPKKIKRHTRSRESNVYAPGLNRITKDGEYIYGTEHSPQTEAFSFRIGQFSMGQNVNPETNHTFGEIYGDSGIILFMDYEWQFWQALGKLGLKLGSGLFVATGEGRFLNPSTGYDKAHERFTFEMFPNNLSLLWRPQFWSKQYVVPFIEGGAGYYTFTEIRDDFKNTKYGGVPIGQWAAGASILLDWLDPESLLEMDVEHGINHLWLTAEFRAIYALNDRLDVSNNIFSAGFLFEF
jgi:hypothetical protein